MKLIVGLGNPGKKYALTRHNMGFMVCAALVKKHDMKFRKQSRFQALAAEGIIEGKKILIAEPQTYMNLSGGSVGIMAGWLKADLKDMLIIIDDIALPFGKIRLRSGGSEAGHKGLRSIIDCLGTNKMPRLRIGIMGRDTAEDCSKYVLSNFTKKEQKDLPRILEAASEACECWIKEGINEAMNRYN